MTSRTLSEDVQDLLTQATLFRALKHSRDRVMERVEQFREEFVFLWELATFASQARNKIYPPCVGLQACALAKTLFPENSSQIWEKGLEICRLLLSYDVHSNPGNRTSYRSSVRDTLCATSASLRRKGWITLEEEKTVNRLAFSTPPRNAESKEPDDYCYNSDCDSSYVDMSPLAASISDIIPAHYLAQTSPSAFCGFWPSIFGQPLFDWLDSYPDFDEENDLHFYQPNCGWKGMGPLLLACLLGDLNSVKKEVNKPHFSGLTRKSLNAVPKPEVQAIALKDLGRRIRALDRISVQDFLPASIEHDTKIAFERYQVAWQRREWSVVLGNMLFNGPRLQTMNVIPSSADCLDLLITFLQQARKKTLSVIT